MNLLEVIRVVGTLLLGVAAAMVPPAVVGIFEGLGGPWMLSVAITGITGGVALIATPKIVSISSREGLAIVGLGWVAIVLFGAIPFVLSGYASVERAVFESVSGFTTTGATIFEVIEDLPASILLWRSVSHWVGGMGIIVLGVAILPLIGVGGAQLFRAEVPGVSSDRLTPRIANTARLLWGVYVGLTVVLFLIYVVLGMPAFDSVNHAMSALATGGFSTRTQSIGAYSPAIQWVTIVFMILAGTNFTLHHRMLTGRWKSWFGDAEWRWYISIMGIAAICTFLSLGFALDDWSGTALRDSLFSVVAVVTTTGYGTADFAAWPSFVQVLLLGLMFVGAMGGSTGGGFKVVRLIAVAKHAAGEIRKLLHPRAVVVPKLGKRPIRGDVMLNIMAFLALYVATHGVGTLILAAMGYDLVTSTSATLAAMSSIGPGLGAVGPAENYAFMSAPAHVVLAALMLLGRLEFYTLLVLFIPETWSRWGGTR